jgi:hypothetical protein
MYRKDKVIWDKLILELRLLWSIKTFRLFLVWFILLMAVFTALSLADYTINRQFRNEMLENQKELMQSLRSEQGSLKLIVQDILGNYSAAMPDSIYFFDRLISTRAHPVRQILNPLFSYLLAYPENKIAVGQALERFHFYEQAISDTLKNHNLHSDLRFVGLAESWAKYDAVSDAGAVGLFQFMQYTARELGVEINEDVDMRRDPWYMSKVFCDYIQYLREKTESYDEALRAYNTGLRRFLEAASRQSWVKKTWFIDVNSENNIYMFWLLAWKIIYEKPERFGLRPDYNYEPAQIKVIQVKMDYESQIDFLELARMLKCDVITLRYLNPAFIRINKEGQRVFFGNHRKTVSRYLKIPISSDLNALREAKIKGIEFMLN